MARTSSSGRHWSSSKISNSSPCANSVTTQNSLFVSNASTMAMMLSCFNPRRISISWRRDLMSLSVLPCLAMNFIAVICPVNFLRALYTFPKLPSPTSSMTW
jgi:hypothetical protein